jgi:hypothetical protein
MRKPYVMKAVAFGVSLTLWTVMPSARQDAARPVLAGTWQLNRELSTAPGSGDLPDTSGPGDDGPRGGGRGGGGRGGGMGRPGGMGSGPGAGGMAQRPSAEEIARRRALIDEAMQLLPRFAVTQKGDTISFIEPDGVVRSYVANGRSEKHQLTNGVVDTRTAWKGEVLEMEVKVDRLTLRRRFALGRDGLRRLEVTTAFDGGRRGTGPKSAYDEAEPQ